MKEIKKIKKTIYYTILLLVAVATIYLAFFKSPEPTTPIIEEQNTATSNNQEGGITAGKIENLTQIEGDVFIYNEPRVLSAKTIQDMKLALATLPKFEVEIITSMGDGESHELGQQIKKEFEKFDWNVTIIQAVVVNPPLGRGMKLYFGDPPSAALQTLFAPIFIQFGYPLEANNADNLSNDFIKLYIGSK